MEVAFRFIQVFCNGLLYIWPILGLLLVIILGIIGVVFTGIIVALAVYATSDALSLSLTGAETGH
ncbi:MAG: hypothetical protein QF485_00515 [Arenicellales bacterium]|jgi:hypothetical protein|nr:hypothetical protein [Arenicellales bacterium]